LASANQFGHKGTHFAAKGETFAGRYVGRKWVLVADKAFRKLMFTFVPTNNRKRIIIMMEIGTKAPDVLGRDENGNEVRLSDFKGKKLVLYFYPKDLTSGCTTQACNLRDNYAELQKQGYAVVGVSINDEKSHKKFIEKHDLPFPLIADTEHKLVEEFGVWGEKSMYGRKYFGTFRTTFIINEEGVITRIMQPKEIKVKEHAEQILGK